MAVSKHGDRPDVQDVLPMTVDEAAMYPNAERIEGPRIVLEHEDNETERAPGFRNGTNE